jgi:hypothetical protein
MANHIRKPRTRAQWAAAIKVAHTKTVGAVLKLGLTLLAAKRALPHGSFLKMIKEDLPFTASTAQRLMKIAADPRLAKAAHAQLLPRDWSILYALTKLSDEAFAQAISAKAVHPEMTRQGARHLTVAYTKTPVDLGGYTKASADLGSYTKGPVDLGSCTKGPLTVAYSTHKPSQPLSIVYAEKEPTISKLVAPAVPFLVQDILKAIVTASINNEGLPTVEEMAKFVRSYGQVQPGWLYDLIETLTALARELDMEESRRAS